MLQYMKAPSFPTLSFGLVLEVDLPSSQHMHVSRHFGQGRTSSWTKEVSHVTAEEMVSLALAMWTSLSVRGSCRRYLVDEQTFG